MSLDLSTSVVTVNGSVDLESTLRNVAQAVNTYNALQANDLEVIGVATHAVFDQYKGSKITTPALKSLVIAKLGNVSPANFQNMSDRVADFVHANPEVFSIGKGKGGGISRVCDQPVKA